MKPKLFFSLLIFLFSYVASYSKGYNEVYVSSFSKNQLITEKFDEDGNLKSKLAIDASIRYKSAMDPVIKISPLVKYDNMQGDRIDLAVKCRNKLARVRKFCYI